MSHNIEGLFPFLILIGVVVLKELRKRAKKKKEQENRVAPLASRSPTTMTSRTCHEIVNKEKLLMREAQGVRWKEPQAGILKQGNDDMCHRKGFKGDNPMLTSCRSTPVECPRLADKKGFHRQKKPRISTLISRLKNKKELILLSEILVNKHHIN